MTRLRISFLRLCVSTYLNNLLFCGCLFWMIVIYLQHVFGNLYELLLCVRMITYGRLLYMICMIFFSKSNCMLNIYIIIYTFTHDQHAFLIVQN